MNLKLVKIASVREHMDAHYRGEISYSKAVDLINEDANKQLMLGAVLLINSNKMLITKEQQEALVDKLLTEQREICCKKMNDWCDYNKLKKCGHIVLYAPRP